MSKRIQNEYYCNSIGKIKVFDHCELKESVPGNRKQQNGRQNRKYLHLGNYDRQRRNTNGKPGVFDYGEFKGSVRD